MAVMHPDQGSDVLDSNILRMGQKIEEFKAVVTSLEGIENFDLAACINNDVSSESASISVLTD